MKIVLLFLMMAPSIVLANQRASCWPQFNAVNQELYLEEGSQLEVVVQGARSDVENRTVLIVESNSHAWTMTAKFRDGFPELGLAQNIYAVTVLGEDGEVLRFEDFTGGCKGPGLSFFPGQKIDLLTLDKHTLNSPRIHLLLWSR